MDSSLLSSAEQPNAVSIQPGVLSAELNTNVLHIHIDLYIYIVQIKI